MVYKISQDAAEAFMAGRYFKRSNTEVNYYGSKTVLLLLYGNLIATRDTDAEYFDISTAYTTRTTLSRLNALPGVRLNVRRGIMHFCGKPIQSGESWIRVYSSDIDFDKLGQILEG